MSNDTASAQTMTNAPIPSFDYSPIDGVDNLDDSAMADSSGFISVDTTGPLTTDPESFTMTFNRPGEPVPVTF